MVVLALIIFIKAFFRLFYMVYRAVSTFSPGELFDKRYELLFNELSNRGVTVDVMPSAYRARLNDLLIKYKKRLGSADIIFHIPEYTKRDLYYAYQEDFIDWANTREHWASVEFDSINEGRLKDEAIFQHRLNEYIRGLNDSGRIVDSDIFIDDDHEVYELLRNNSIPTVEHLTVNDWFNDKFFPAVFKLNGTSQGRGIYVVDDEFQLSKMFDYHSFGVKNICDFKTDDFRISRFIECPSNYYTHYRVFTVGSGKILGAVLSYSGFKKSDDVRVTSDWLMDAYDYPKSPIFLNRRDIMSNKSRGGNQIPLNLNKHSRAIINYEESILKEHGITNQELPKEINDYAITAARLLGKKGLYVLGQDWIQDLNGDFICLEVNYQPGLEIFGTLYNNSKSSECIAAVKIASEIIDNLNKKIE